MTCRWDKEADDYLTPEGELCRRDDYGDPTQHCTSRRTCNQHVGPQELTCARCLGRTRQDIRQIVDRAAEMLPEAIITGVNSEAANLAGPAADPEAWSWHKITAKQGRIWHASLVEDDDELHAFTVLTGWAWRLSAQPPLGYGGETPDVWTVSNAADYLLRILHRVAHDDDQDFGQMAREMKRCRAHLEAVLRDSLTPDLGVPCPTCVEHGRINKLERVFPHWCTNPDCTEQFHPTTDDFDEWHCPRHPDHWWTAAGYAELIDQRKVAG